VLYVVKTPFGLVLQGIRDNPRRVSAIGFNVGVHRVASFALAGFIAGWGGVLITFYNIGITPGSIGIWATVNVLVMAVIGGLGHPIGAFIGALVFTLLDTFAATIYDRDRFNTLIGLVFLVIVLVSPDGLLGLFAALPAGGPGSVATETMEERRPDEPTAAGPLRAQAARRSRQKMPPRSTGRTTRSSAATRKT
jgi:branched-chain amino acid transport system permease protein